MRHPLLALLILATLSSTACTATVGASGNVSVPEDSASICTRHCQSIGMQLTAVAIMASNVGCVCQPTTAPRMAETDAGSSTATAGMATISMQQAQQQQQQQQQHYAAQSH